MDESGPRLGNSETSGQVASDRKFPSQAHHPVLAERAVDCA